MPLPMAPGAMLRTLRILCGAMIVSLGFYIGIGFFLSDQLATMDHGTAASLPPGLLIAICVASAAMLGAVPVIRRQIWNNRGGQRYFVLCLVSWAMCEAVGILGLMLTLISRDPRYALAFGAVAALNLLLYRPTAAGLAAAAGPPEEPGT